MDSQWFQMKTIRWLFFSVMLASQSPNVGCWAPLKTKERCNFNKLPILFRGIETNNDNLTNLGLMLYANCMKEVEKDEEKSDSYYLK